MIVEIERSPVTGIATAYTSYAALGAYPLSAVSELNVASAHRPFIVYIPSISTNTPFSSQLEQSKHHTHTPMSQTHHPDSSPHNFRRIFNNALKAYEKHAKKYLLSYPFASQLQALPISGLHSRYTSTASAGAQPISKQRRKVNQVACPDRQCPLCRVRDDWRIGGFSMSYNLNISYLWTLLQIISPTNVIFVEVGVPLSVRSLFPLFARAICNSYIP